MQIIDFYQALIERQLPIIVDSHKIDTYSKEQGYKTIFFDDYDFKSEQAAFLIFSDYNYYYKLKQLWHDSRSIIVHLPAVKFDGSLAVIQYSFNQLISSDIEQALAIRDILYDKIADTETELSLSDLRGSKLNCQLTENIEIANADLELEPGWFYSVAEFWESSVVNTKANKSSFSVDGIFYFDGILSQTTTQETKENNWKPLKYLTDQVVNSQEKYLRIENNAITQLIIDGQNETSVLLDMSYNLERGLSLTEIAFGVNKKIRETVDWSINSVVNEGIYGTHVGIGMAQKAPHIDFISQVLELA
ncbi:MAG: hypothetical protein V7K89_27630 [Nostoc sp.]|uniref:hypothetical protein n=1 Tax=Nostoc sp. TaxID=1180 RepID=UPI002FFC1426